MITCVYQNIKEGFGNLKSSTLMSCTSRKDTLILQKFNSYFRSFP